MTMPLINVTRALALCGIAFCTTAQAGSLTLKPLQQFWALDFSTSSSQAIDFPVGAGGDVLIRVATEEQLALRLRLPDGTTVEPANAADYGVRFETFSPSNPYELLFSPTPAMLVHIENAAAGRYTLAADGASSAGSVPVTITGIGMPLRGGMAVNGGALWAGAGSPVAISFALFDEAVPVAGATITAHALTANGESIAPIVFRDDGRRGDGEAGDGLYTGAFTPPAAGTYFIQADVSGTDTRGHAFAGRDTVRLVVREEGLRLTGAFTDRGVDDDNDGFWDAVRFEFLTEGPRQAGDYSIHLQLASDGGKRVSAAARVSDQAASLAVEVPAEKLKTLAADGPYNVEYAILWHGDEPVDRWENLGVTAAYKLSELERNNSLLHPVHHDEGVDLDGDGLFDRLDLTFDADVLIPGYYGFSADLRAPDGTILDDSGLPQVYLERGHNDVTVHFTGTKIGEGGQDGPYRLTNVLLYPLFNASASALADRLGETSAYECSQFPQCASAGGSIEERFARLRAQVEVLPLNRGLRKSLIVKLEGAQRAWERGHKNSVKVASSKVRAFINELVAQRDKHVPRNQADLLIDGAAALRELIEL